MKFSYDEMTLRNLGFVNEAEQDRIRNSRVFVCGTGGMGGACLQTLVRAGVGSVEIADMDRFEVSNFNRQVFSDLESVGKEKAASTEERLKKINPDLELRSHAGNWTEKIDEILDRCKVVINGMDDIAAGIHLYRKAKEHGRTVIDAYSAPLPSVFVVTPEDLRPEERYKNPSVGKRWDRLNPSVIDQCKLNEMVYVLTHSSSFKHIHMRFVKEMMEGKRARMSFAPMVITTGNLMAYEAIKIMIGKGPCADAHGYFFNPWTMTVEKPLSAPVAAAKSAVIRQIMKRLA
jgi:molybdopterin/thiamine biosynthesis adenylyltransferase